MKKFPWLIGIVTIVVIVGGVILLSRGGTEDANSTPLPLPSTYEYYWGDGCPHCAVVQEFYDSWEDYDKANIEKYEVWYNKVNNSRMIKRATSCGIGKDQLGVPLLFTPEGECITGDEPIIELFKGLDFSEEEESES